jgi:hypothetical protein
MKNLKAKFALLLLSMLGLFTGAHAQLAPSGDSYTNTADPTTNYGAKTTLDVESSQTTYIQFNLSSIPAGYTSSDITQATLKLYVNAVTTAGSFNVDYVNGTWTESTITADKAPALGTTIAASIPLTTADKNQYILINVTAAVQAWLSGTANDGIALVGNSPVNASFDSKENTTTSHPAELDIVFTPGSSGGGITGITTSSSSGLIGGGTSGTLNLSLINTCAAKQILQWTGSAWACASPGTITGVTAGTDLTGGGTSGTVTVNVDTTKVPQLAVANTFTGAQTINNAVSITSSATNPLVVTNTSSSGNGISGSGPSGVYGNDKGTPGGTGVVGSDTSGTGNGVEGIGGTGVRGLDTIAGGTGVYGADLSGSGYGVYGTGGLGVYGSGGTGVLGTDNGFAGVGVQGLDTSGSSIGVLGTGYIGVSGSNASGTGVGVYGSVAGSSGVGGGNGSAVWGDAGGADGLTTAVYGTAGADAAGDFENDSKYYTLNVNNAAPSSSDATVFFASGSNGDGFCEIDVNGNLTCDGTVGEVVGVQGGAHKVALNSVQSPENWFEDFGSGMLTNGTITVTLDPTFGQTVNTGIEYHVFLTPKGDCKGLYVANENARGFDVRELGGGTSNVAFDYRVVAKRLGYENIRLADMTEHLNKLYAHQKKMRDRMHPGTSPMAIPKPPVLPKAFDQPKLPALSTHAAMEPVAAQQK